MSLVDIPASDSLVFRDEFIRIYPNPVTLEMFWIRNRNLFLHEPNWWPAYYPFFMDESASGLSVMEHTETRDRGSGLLMPTAVSMSMLMVYAIRRNLPLMLLDGRYFRTSSSISRRAMVILRCVSREKIEIESWPKEYNHPLLATWCCHA